MSTYLICIPTYNEAENIRGIIERTLATGIPDLSILVIDDGSPDGTANIVDALALELKNPQIHLLKRASKSGLGPAYLAAFAWALEHSFDYVVEMDADGSHQPEELGRLIEASQHSDLVLGTRWMAGGKVENWPFYRRAISRIGTWYAEMALKVPYKDLTGGYRVLSKNLLETIDLHSVQTLGYGFQIEIAMRAFDARLKVAEVPITFIERTQGRSKMSKRIVFEALERTTIWGFQRRLIRR
jgi:dolichol-phosphate mannosyltransferase